MVDNNDSSAGCSCCSDCADTTLNSQTVTLDGCSCGPGCCEVPKSVQIEKRRIVIDFLFLDVSVCTRCQGADTSLDEALSEVSKVLEATGVEVFVNKINVNSEELAKQYKFVSSPTIRLNGRDIQMDVKESSCESCGDLCGADVDCRVWVYQGNEYTIPPKAMIIEALLKEVYSGSHAEQKEPEYLMPDNLKKFYDAMKKVPPQNRKAGLILSVFSSF